MNPNSPPQRFKQKRRLALLLLLVWMPLYIVAVASLLSVLPRFPLILELLVYLAAGLLCFLPFRRVFLGVGRAQSDAAEKRSKR